VLGLIFGFRSRNQYALKEIVIAGSDKGLMGRYSYCEENYKTNCRINTTYMVELPTIYLMVYFIYNAFVHG
jgi:hypothetical protein